MTSITKKNLHGDRNKAKLPPLKLAEFSSGFYSLKVCCANCSYNREISVTQSKLPDFLQIFKSLPQYNAYQNYVFLNRVPL